MPFNQFGCQPDPTILLFICLLTMNPNNFPWTNRDWKRKRQNKRKWNNNRSGTVWCSVPTIGSVKATRAGQSWLMRIWKGRQLSPHIRLGLLWYLILPNFLFGDTKKKQYIIRWDAQGNFTNDILSVASKRKAFFSALHWEKCSGRQKFYRCELSIGRVLELSTGLSFSMYVSINMRLGGVNRYLPKGNQMCAQN